MSCYQDWVVTYCDLGGATGHENNIRAGQPLSFTNVSCVLKLLGDLSRQGQYHGTGKGRSSGTGLRSC